MAPAILRDPLSVVTRVARESGDIGSFWLGRVRVVVITTPELVRRVLIEDAASFDKGPRLTKALRPLLGEGLITSDGDLHARQRKLVSPYFVPREVTRFVTRTAAHAARTCERWPDDEEIEVVHEMHRLTMDLVGDLLLGTRVGEDPRLVEAISTAFDWEMRRLTQPLSFPLAVPTARNIRMRGALRYLRRRIGGIIDARRRSGERPDDMLSMLLSLTDEDGRPLTKQQVYDETLTLCGAAQESTADALAWTLYLLARNPDVLAELHAEVDGALGTRLPTAEDLPRLPASLRIFKEALRMYPPAALMMRSSTRDTVLAGYRVPAGTVVIVPPWAVHYRPDIYPDPHRFDPSRFDPDNERKIPKCGYLPFGAGARACLGKHLALIEGQVMVATFAQRVTLDLSPDWPVAPELKINLRARHGIRATVRRRR